jgi:hypothetical protein
MDFNKFYKEGWGLHRGTIEQVYNLIRNNNITSVLEFGSGASTEFFIEARNELNKAYTIDSFDHNIDFSYNSTKPDYLNLMIRDLVVCSDESYNEMFKTKKFNDSAFVTTEKKLDTGIRNATYKLNKGDLKKSYDLVLIDGPNGNGRNFSYFYMKNRLKSGSIVVIDDYFHYDFVEKLGEFFEYELISEIKFSNDHPNKGHVIVKIK